MNEPYFHTIPGTKIKQAVEFDNMNGVTYREVGGETAIWAARVPFLPAMLSDDFTRLGKQRTLLIQQRQFRFIYDLARARDNHATFELRFISNPNPVRGQPNLIEIVFLGKVFAINARHNASQHMAERLWEKFVSNFPLEDPFNYPLEPVTHREEFLRYYEPLPFKDLDNSNIIEIRKYEEMPIRSMAPLGRVERKGDYIAHPFVPNFDFSPMGRFFVALASQPHRSFASISIKPTRMFDQEIYNVSFAIGQFKRTASEDDDVTEEYIRSRSRIGIHVYQQLMEDREQLVMVRVHLVGEHQPPYGLAEALGSEMMGNINNTYPTQWSAVQPADELEMAAALSNLRYLEHEIWGHTIASPPLVRLRYLATAQEAVGAFRLPVPPESGYMPGILVKSEPFVALPEELELRRQARANLNDAFQETIQDAREKKVNLGMVFHRGNATPQPFYINVKDLTRHMLIAGSTGSGKSTTIKHLLSQLWIQHQIPFLVLYPIDKPDYRELYGFSGLRRDLLTFTLGDVSTSPFRFNPFEVPEGLLLKTHLSRLMRVFMAAFSLHDPLPMIYREALRQIYREKGWDTILDKGSSGRDYPVMSDFFAAIQAITDSLEYGKEVKDNVRQASVIRIADLLENAGHVVNVRTSMSFVHILNHPTIMEIGRVGSIQDTSLLMGFLLMRFAEEVERNPRPSSSPHITVVEEAHRLMADTSPSLGQAGDGRSAAGEDFANILAEVRGYGEGIIIAEQIPTLLVKGAIGNTFVKVMHWLEDAPSFDLFANIMNLNTQQREYVRTLTPGFAVVRSPSGRPVHIKVPEFGDQPGFERDVIQDISDEQIAQLMNAQRTRFGLEEISVIPWNAHLTSSTKTDSTWKAPEATLSWMLSLPMKTCVFCKPLHDTQQCLHAARVRNRIHANSELNTRGLQLFEEALRTQEDESRWKIVREIEKTIHEQVPDLTPSEPAGVLYCFLAHAAEQWVSSHREASFTRQRAAARSILQRFYTRKEYQ